MNYRKKIKELIQENIFEIYESFETNDTGRQRNVEHKLYNVLGSIEWSGWKYPLKAFTYKYMNIKFCISYEWKNSYIKKLYRKKKGKYGYYEIDRNRDSYRKKVTYIHKIKISKVDKNEKDQIWL